MKAYQFGVVLHDANHAMPGFTLVAAMRHEHCELIDNTGHIVHRWQLPGLLGSKAILLPNGNLMCSVLTRDGEPIAGAIPIPGALGGRMLELDWDGNIQWELTDPNQHHDFCRTDNGNTLYLSRQILNSSLASQVQGGITDTGLPAQALQGKMVSDVIREVSPSGAVQWQWDSSQLDLTKFPLAPDCHRGEYAHINSIALTNTNQVLVSFRHLDTVLIIDRTTNEIVWHLTDRSWGHQHDAQMLPTGNILLFANGMNNLAQPLHSRALELDPATGKVVWEFVDPQRWTFFTPVMGGVQRLENGNTLLCESLSGRVFEVSSTGEIVWDYINPNFHPNAVVRGPANALFRANRYSAGFPGLIGRI